MPKVYDPILCMMVDKPATRTTDAKATDKAGEMWFLKVDGKTITAFEKWGAPVAEAKKYMRENNIPGVGILKRLGRPGEYTITAKDSTIDKAIKCMDGNKYVNQAVKWLEQGKSKTEVIFGLQRMGLTPTDASSYLAKAMAETGYKYNK